MATLLEEERAARDMGVTGVPCFIIQGKYVIQGAQEPDTWARVISEIGEAVTKGAAEEESLS
ncbi:MAG: DsbA family protein, partial [Pseudomonadota bacterium]